MDMLFWSKNLKSHAFRVEYANLGFGNSSFVISEVDLLITITID